MSVARWLLRLLLGRRLPVTSGELRVRGLGSVVTVRRDEYGIPHIDAASELDAVLAFGFCQAQDRAGQLELLWRLGRGRLAEWVGPGGLPADRLSRRLGLRRAAERQLAALAPAPRGLLEAFTAGIAAGYAAGLPVRPHEFAILGGQPSAWDAADVLTLLKLQSFLLPSNWDVELARLQILLADGHQAVRDLDPVAGVTAADLLPGTGEVVTRLAEELAALRQYLPAGGGGSNNWVIAGSRTASGKPLLANDPHLPPSVPPPWYLGHLRCPEWEAAGAALAGTPAFAIGHNGFAAWGVTAGLTDNTDLFLETLGPDGRSVRQPDGSFAPCEVRREVIRVRGRADVVEEVLVTPRGPVISPLVPDLPVVVSLRAVWLEPLPVAGFLGTQQARSFDEFRRPFADWPLLPLNLVYADAAGTIGYQLVGQVPRRPAGCGLLPRPADRPESAWDGWLPLEELPHGRDFPAGFFATANNPPPGATAALGYDFCDPYRVRAIQEALAAHDQWTVEDCLRLQRDVRSLPWEEMREVVLSLPADDPAVRDGLALLRDWDGRVDSESPAASVYELFVAELCRRVARAKAPRAWAVALGEGGMGLAGHSLFTDRRVGHLVRLIREQPPGWFASWPAEMAAALGAAVRWLRRRAGPGPAYWAWGHLRMLRLDHLLFGGQRWLAPAFNLGPFPCGGDCNTISQAGARPATPTAFTHNMANLRAVFDLADPARSRFVLCGGQSGNPCSPHYADQLPLWLAGEALTPPWHQADVIRAAKATLRLLPDGPPPAPPPSPDPGPVTSPP